MSGVHTLEATKNPAGLNLRGVVMAWDLLSVPSKGADDQKEGEQQAKPEIPKYAQQGFHQITSKAMRMDGHPWLQAPSGSTTQPSVQHAGDVDSHMALRANCSRVSGVNPSFSRASVAVMR